MLRNYLKVALRRFRRQPLYTTINVTGLAVGMAACLLIGLYVHDELRVDHFHEKSDRIVQVGSEAGFFGRSLNTSYPLARVLEQEMPRVRRAVHTRARNSTPLRHDASGLDEKKQVLTASPGFFDVFTFPTLHGNASAALRHADGLVLTASTARAYFDRTNAVGETLTAELDDETHTLTVRAVVTNVPRASTIDFDAVVPIRLTEEPSWTDGWGMFMFRTYALLNRPAADVEELQGEIQRAVGQHSDRDFEYFAMDLTSVYLSSLHNADGFRGQARYLYIFGSIAVFVLLIAAINFVNLATAQGARRAREVGMRKTMGAGRGRLVRQFLGESVLLSVGALGLAVLLARITLPAFNQLFGTSLAFAWDPHGWILLGLAVFVLLVGVAAGAYPAFVLTRFEPVTVLRQHTRTTTGGDGWLRRGLVVTQFAISAALIVGTVVVYQQLNYVQTKDLGFSGEQVVTVQIPEDAQGRRQVLARRANAHPSVQRVTLATGLPGTHGIRIGLSPSDLSPKHQVQDTESSIEFRPAVIDTNYVETLGLTLVAGRDANPDRPSDLQRGVLLNETGARRMGWTPEEAIGKPFSLDEQSRTVIGVVADYHVSSLHHEIGPIALLYEESESFSLPYALSARLASGGIGTALDHLEQQVEAIAPSAAVEYSFLDDAFAEAYRAERRLSRIFTAFAGLAILIACLGLFGLAAHAAEKRTREIGIRKALGATAAQVVGLLSKEFAVLVGIALLLGAPVAYLGMQQWLQDFAFRIDLGVVPFVATALAAVVIAGLSVSVHALRAAHTDPARALRSE